MEIEMGLEIYSQQEMYWEMHLEMLMYLGTCNTMMQHGSAPVEHGVYNRYGSACARADGIRGLYRRGQKSMRTAAFSSPWLMG